IDEPPYQPGAGHPVDMHAATGNPGLALQIGIGAPRRCHGFALRGRPQPALDVRDETLRDLAAAGFEEVDRRNFRQPFAQALDTPGDFAPRLLRHAAGIAGALGEAPGLVGDLAIVGVARLVELRADVLIAESVDHPGLADAGLAAAIDNLAQQ